MEDNDQSKAEYTTDPRIIKSKLNAEYDKYDVYDSVFTLPIRYEIIKALGSGAYGWVALAKDDK